LKPVSTSTGVFTEECVSDVKAFNSSFPAAWICRGLERICPNLPFGLSSNRSSFNASLTEKDHSPNHFSTLWTITRSLDIATMVGRTYNDTFNIHFYQLN